MVSLPEVFCFDQNPYEHRCCPMLGVRRSKLNRSRSSSIAMAAKLLVALSTSASVVPDCVLFFSCS